MPFIIRRVFSIVISIFLFLSTAEGVKYEPKDAENIKLNAVILSDVHIEGNNPDRWQRFGQTLKGVYANKTKPDIVAFAGDNTMNGQWIEWFDYYGLLNRFNKKSEILVGFGNHDFGNNDDAETYAELSKRCIKCYNGYIGGKIDKVYYSKEINGYKFIMLASEQNLDNLVSSISDEQIEWLKAELKEAADEGKPAFVVNHNLVEGKNGFRSNWDFNVTDNNKALADTLENAGTKVIYFCGHSHVALRSDSVQTYGNATYVNLPSAGNTGNYYPENDGYDDFGIGCNLEVYENSMVLRFRNFAKGEWLEGYDDIVIDL